MSPAMLVKGNLVRKTSCMAQTCSIAQSFIIFYRLSVPLHRKTPSHLVFVALFCARNSHFSKNISALLPCSGDPKCPAPPCQSKRLKVAIDFKYIIIHSMPMPRIAHDAILFDLHRTVPIEKTG